MNGICMNSSELSAGSGKADDAYIPQKDIANGAMLGPINKLLLYGLEELP